MTRIYPKQPYVGVGAILVRSGKILLVKRKNEPGTEKWSIPGGVVELGEETTSTVIREIQEETGLIVEKPVLIDVINDVELDPDGRIKYQFVIIDYFLKIKGGRLKAASDAAEAKWVLLSEVESYVLTKTFLQFFANNRAKLNTLDSAEDDG